MSLREMISKTTIANIVSGICVVGTLIYAFYTKDTKLITFLAGAGVGYLFKTIKEGVR